MPLRFINPNYHVILIHYPLGVFVLGVFLELFSIFWRRSSIRLAARWMIALGALLMLPSATSGIFALHDVRKQGIDPARYEMLKSHVWLMGCATILAVACAVIGIGASNRWRRKLYFPLLAGVVAAWGLMVVGSWHGGETIYQQGTGVAIIKVNKVRDDDGNLVRDAKGQPIYKTVYKKLPEPQKRSFKDYQDVVNYYIGGDLQIHIITAGFAFAVAMGALGLSIRRLTSASSEESEPEPVLLQRTATVGAAVGGHGAANAPRRVTDDISVLRSFNPDVDIEAEPERLPVFRFWLLTAVVVIATAVLGYWVVAGQNYFNIDGWHSFRDSLVTNLLPGQRVGRYKAHLALGCALLALALLCGTLAAFAPRRPVLLGIAGLLLVLVIAAQIWIGVLMTFDGEGKLTHFKTSAERTQQSSAIELPEFALHRLRGT